MRIGLLHVCEFARSEFASGRCEFNGFDKLRIVSGASAHVDDLGLLRQMGPLAA